MDYKSNVWFQEEQRINWRQRVFKILRFLTLRSIKITKQFTDLYCERQKIIIRKINFMNTTGISNKLGMFLEKF